jgi:hypothetical protein
MVDFSFQKFNRGLPIGGSVCRNFSLNFDFPNAISVGRVFSQMRNVEAV